MVVSSSSTCPDILMEVRLPAKDKQREVLFHFTANYPAKATCSTGSADISGGLNAGNAAMTSPEAAPDAALDFSMRSAERRVEGEDKAAGMRPYWRVEPSQRGG